jgi:hypothetical protein
MRGQLRHLHRLAGSPTKDRLKEHADRAGHSVSRAALASVTVDSDSAPRWATVEAFIDACVHYAKACRRPLPDDQVDMSGWKTIYDQAYPARRRDTPPKWISKEDDAGRRVVRVGLPFRLPSLWSGSFVGRSEELKRLELALAGSGRVAVVAVHGLGGVGKSTLAAWFADLHRDRFASVWWMTADSPAAIDIGLAELAVAVTPEIATAPLLQRVETGLQWLADNQDWLVILDNLTAPADADALRSRVSTGAILITSRRSGGWQSIPTVALGVLPANEAKELLARTVHPDRPDTNSDGVERLCEELGHLPLAIYQAGSYIAQTQITPASYLELLAECPESMFVATTEGGDTQRTIARVWRVTLDRLADTPIAGNMLRWLAWYAADRIPRSLVEAAGREREIREALGRLAAYSMIILDTETIGVHRLVQAVSRTPDSADPHRAGADISAALGQATDALARALREQDIDDPEAPPVYTALTAHVWAMARNARDHPLGARRPDVIALQVRYELVAASVGSISTNVTPDLLSERVVREPKRVMSILRMIERITEEDQRADALVRLLDLRSRDGDSPVFPDHLVPDAWTLALAFKELKPRRRAVTALIPRLPENLLDSAIEAVRALTQHSREPWVLEPAAALLDRLPEERLTNFPWLALPDMAYDVKMVINYMASLRLRLPTAADTVLHYLMNEIEDGFDRCQYLATLIPRLPATAFDKAIQVLESCPAEHRGDALVALARQARGNQLIALLSFAAQDLEWTTPPPQARQQPWLDLMRALPQLTESQQEAAVDLALTLRPQLAAEALEILAPNLSDKSSVLEKALSAVDEQLGDHRSKLIMVGALISDLPRGKAQEVVARYVDIDLHLTSEPDLGTAEDLAPVAAYLPDDTARMTLRRICRQISLSGYDARKFRPSLERMARLVRDKGLMSDVSDMMLSPGAWRPSSRLEALSVLAPYLNDSDLNVAMRQFVREPIEVEGFHALADLGQTVPEDDGGRPEIADIAHRAFDSAQQISNHRQRIRAVAALTPIMPTELAEQALDLVGSMRRLVLFPSVFHTLDALAPRLPRASLSRAFLILRGMPEFGSDDIPTVARLVKRLGQHDPERALLGLLQSDSDGSWFPRIAPFLSAPAAEQALTAARRLPDHARLMPLAAVAPRLADTQQRVEVAHEALRLLNVAVNGLRTRMTILARLAEATTLNEITTACQRVVADLQTTDLNDSDDQHACADLMRHLPDDAIETALAVSGRMRYLGDRCRILMPLAPRLQTEVVHELITNLEGTQGEFNSDLRQRERTLVALAEALDENDDLRRRCLAALLDRLVKRPWWYINELAFTAMIPLLSWQLRSRAIEAALQQSDWQDPDALIGVLRGTELPMALAKLDKIADQHKRVSITAAVLRHAGTLADNSEMLPEIDVLATWRQATTRPDLFKLIGASAWWIHRQGAANAITMTAEAILDL